MATKLTVSIPLLIVISSFCIAIVAGSVATWSLYTGSRRAIEANLVLLAHSKRNEVDALITSVRKDLTSATSDPLIAKALDGIATAVKIMPADRRATLPSDYSGDTVQGPPAIRPLSDYYGRAYDQVHPFFRTLATDTSYDDILFVDAKGTVAYTLAKRTDYTANIHDDALKGSVLADLVERAATLPAGTTLTTDFRFYGPAQRPVALMGAPIYDRTVSRHDLIGVLVFQLPGRRIDAILNDPQGFSDTGEAFLAGPDGRLRSTSRLSGRDDVLQTSLAEARLISPSATGEVAETWGFRGRAMIAASQPLSIEGLNWAVVATEDLDEMLQPVRLMVFRILLTCLGATLLLAWLAVVIAGRLARPVVALMERFDAALSNMPHGLVMVDAERRLILCNTAYRDLYELPVALTQSGTPLAVIEDHQKARGMASPEPIDWSHETDLRRELGDGRTIDLVRHALPSGGYVATHQNMTAAVRAQKQITFLATHDALTGLPNRVSFADRIAEALERARKGESVAVLCLDLDHFKSVNDTLGHPVGDLLLKAVAGRMRGCLRPADVLARLGGDEFVILQTGIGAPDEARLLAQRLIEQIAMPFDLSGNTVVSGISIGIAVAPTDGMEADSLVKNADLALYRAKADGRGSARFFEPEMDAQLQARRQLELDLRMALAGNQFVINYQPVYDAMTQTITGVEALLRWHHPERGVIPPLDFIPLAEERGLIVPIGEWVIRQACKDAAAWPDDIRVAVNLSPIQLKSPALVGTITTALALSGLSPRRLELEITEMVLLSEDEATLATLHALKALGLRIAMDDFGTGYSSLSYLRSFPFDKIKIDRSFVRELGQRADAAAIIRAISDLGSTLGMVTTVEGIETSDQLHLVRKQGCTEVQGYYLCRPIPVDGMASLIARREERPRLSA